MPGSHSHNKKYDTSKGFSKTVYEPSEDSFLLSRAVEKYSSGIVLDMGCGSGIQGITAFANPNTKKVFFADINPFAIVASKNAFLDYINISTNNISKNNMSENNNALLKEKHPCHLSKKHRMFVVSDLFEGIENSVPKIIFDTIIFNPPYLPDDDYDNEKLITTGGKIGSEILERFLCQAKSHLKPAGKILIVFSSLTGKKQIDSCIKRLGYSKKQISSQNLFMEQLFVYMLNISKSRDDISLGRYNNLSIDKAIVCNVFKGHRGIVYREYLDEKKIFIAVKKPISKFYDGAKEAKFLEYLNYRGIGPKLISFDKKNNILITEFIDGDRIIDFFAKDSVTNKSIILVIRLVLQQLLIMDSLGINKFELTNPYKHIIVQTQQKSSKSTSSSVQLTVIKPVLIDFERCTMSRKPKNITQFIQFLCSGRLRAIFTKKGIIVDINSLRALSREYKIKNKYAIQNTIQNTIHNDNTHNMFRTQSADNNKSNDSKLIIANTGAPLIDEFIRYINIHL